MQMQKFGLFKANGQRDMIIYPTKTSNVLVWLFYYCILVAYMFFRGVMYVTNIYMLQTEPTFHN